MCDTLKMTYGPTPRLNDPTRFFDAVIEVDLSTLRPLINGPGHARPQPPRRRGRRVGP
jgi:aconitase A